MLEAQKNDIKTYTQQVREKIISANMKDGTVPNDLEQQKMILATADSMDRTEIGYLRIKQEDKKIDNQQQTNAVVAAILGSTELRNVTKGPIPVGGNSLINNPPDTLIAIQLVPGETEIGSLDLTYDSIMAEQ